MKEKNSFTHSNTIGYRVLLIILSFPLAMIVGRWIPQIIIPVFDGYDIRYFIAFVISSILLQILFYPFRKIISVLGTLGVITFAILFYKDIITKKDLQHFVFENSSKITNNDYFGRSIDNQIGIDKAIKDDNGIESFVNKYKLKYNHFNDCLSEPILASFAMFDEISCKWIYKNDPEYRELFRPVKETIKTKTGDCDDHAICLAACMSQCGAKARIIHADRHLYPELLVGNVNFVNKKRIIKCIYKIYPNTHNEKIYIKEEKDGDLWLSMDYSEKYPGGKNLGNYDFETYELN